jgi:hypothetical protein
MLIRRCFFFLFYLISGELHETALSSVGGGGAGEGEGRENSGLTPVSLSLVLRRRVRQSALSIFWVSFKGEAVNSSKLQQQQ